MKPLKNLIGVGYIISYLIFFQCKAYTNDRSFYDSYKTAKQHSKHLNATQKKQPCIQKALADDQEKEVAFIEESNTFALIDLNTADANVLQRLPYIGPIRAHAIIDYRNQLPTQKFESLEQLLQVPGIGEKRLARIRTKVVLFPQKVNPSKA